MEALHSMNANIIHGAMRVFTGSECNWYGGMCFIIIWSNFQLCLKFIELAGEVTDLQIPHVAPVIFPEMLKIFANPEVCSQILSSCVRKKIRKIKPGKPSNN